MNFRSLLPVLAAVGLLQGADSRLLEVRRVYVLPMSGGLDQYLANRLTQNGRYMVVTDAQSADALLTDTIGVAFEDKYKQLYPPPPAPEDKKEDAAKKKSGSGKDTTVLEMMSSGAGVARTSSFSRGRGNVFLVDRSSRAVIWSTYLKPRNTSPAELNHVADQVVDRMDDAAEHREKAVRKAEGKPAAAVPAPVVTPAPTPAPPAAAAPAPVESKPTPVPQAPAAPAAAPAPTPAK